MFVSTGLLSFWGVEEISLARDGGVEAFFFLIQQLLVSCCVDGGKEGLTRVFVVGTLLAKRS